MFTAAMTRKTGNWLNTFETCPYHTVEYYAVQSNEINNQLSEKGKLQMDICSTIYFLLEISQKCLLYTWNYMKLTIVINPKK